MTPISLYAILVKNQIERYIGFAMKMIKKPVLFHSDPALYDKVKAISSTQNISIGEYIRRSIEERVLLDESGVTISNIK